MKQRIYIDTSVVGGYFDKELRNAPLQVRELLQTIPQSYMEHVKLIPDAEILANKYIDANVVGKTSLTDCQHIAIATLYKADVLVSWNFKHIVNLDKIKGYNGINLLYGYNVIEIRTPKEVMKYGNS
jgi:hypothetical protein